MTKEQAAESIACANTTEDAMEIVMAYSKQEAIDFAEWVGDNAEREEDREYWFYREDAISKKGTTEQLYKIFKPEQ
ncbi:MAG: hypothetical protein ABI091_23390 [Ferruginibacter sp.]